MEFDDGYVLMNQWMDAGWIPRESVAPIEALNHMLDEMGGEANTALWTREALARHQAWRGVRELAMAVSSRLPELAPDRPMRMECAWLATA